MVAKVAAGHLSRRRQRHADRQAKREPKDELREKRHGRSGAEFLVSGIEAAGMMRSE